MQPFCCACVRAKSERATLRWWHTHGAAQNRLGCHVEQSRPRRAEFFAPPVRGILTASPFRRFAYSPFRSSARLTISKKNG